MPQSIKFFITILAAAVFIGILCARPDADNAGPSWLWRGGSRDPVRRLIFRSDGSLKKHTKLVSAAWLMLFLAALWVVVPSSP